MRWACSALRAAAIVSVLLTMAGGDASAQIPTPTEPTAIESQTATATPPPPTPSPEPGEGTPATPTATPSLVDNCCTEHDQPGCNVPACEQCVCAIDSPCCRTPWDRFCVADTVDCIDACPCAQAPAATPTPGGDCCITHEGTGCDAAECEVCVCGIDSLCCDSIWDSTCVGVASMECNQQCLCTPPPGGDCCAVHEGTGCDDETCQSCVCALDTACCGQLWDQTCVDEANAECAHACVCESAGSCCEAHGGVGCDETTCQQCVCDLDAECCNAEVGWDATCVSEATRECAARCPCEVSGSCCEVHEETLGCDDRRCQACVCTVDPNCCTVAWDATCADIALEECANPCDQCAESTCCAAGEEAGCNRSSCQVCVCGFDDFCCSDSWDGMCVTIAESDCVGDCACESVPDCSGDCNGDGMVAVNELIIGVNIVLGSAPINDCLALDGNGDAEVSIAELIQAVNAALGGCP